MASKLKHDINSNLAHKWKNLSRFLSVLIILILIFNISFLVNMTYKNIVYHYYSTNEYLKAEKILNKLISLNERFLGKYNKLTISSKEELARNYIKYGKFLQAQKILEETIAFREKHSYINNFEGIYALSTLGYLYQMEGNYKKAEILYNKILNYYKNKPDKEILSQFDLLNLYLNKGDIENAKKTFNELKKYPADTFSPNNHFYYAINKTLGLYYQKLGQEKEAEKLYQEALKINNTKKYYYPKDLMEEELAKLYQKKGRLKDSVYLFKKAIDSRSKLIGANNPDIAKLITHLGVLYNQMNNVKQSENELDKALRIRLKVLDNNHPDIACSYYYLGLINEKNGKINKSKEYYKKAMDIRKKSLSYYYTDFSDSLKSIELLCNIDRGGY